VDEAHKLSPEVLEEIRLLSNFELAESKLLQIVLAGQTELGALLNREDLRQLKQRIAVRLAIHPLSQSDVQHYIQHRWQKAGAVQPHPFQPDAVTRIAQYSRGIPRLVNVLCDNALMLAYGEGQKSIGVAQIVEVATDLDLLDIRSRTPRTVHGALAAEQTSFERHPKAQGAMSLASTAGHRTANGPPPVSGPAVVPSLERYGANATKRTGLALLMNKLKWTRAEQKL